MSDISITVPSGISSTLVPKLKNLAVVQKLDVHTGLVRDIQFSPDGNYLATTRCVFNFLNRDAYSHYASPVGIEKSSCSM